MKTGNKPLGNKPLGNKPLGSEPLGNQPLGDKPGNGPLGSEKPGAVDAKKPVTGAAETANVAGQPEVSTTASTGRTDAFNALQTPTQQLGLDTVDALWAKGDYAGVVKQLEAQLVPLEGRLKTLDGASTGRWISELHVLQHRGISLANKISVNDNPAAAKSALGLLQTIANLQTEVFERAVSLADAKTPDKAVPAWIVHKDTMKKSGFHSADSRQQYFIDKARDFIEKGGDLSTIEAVSPEALDKYKSGEFVEWVVDSYDVARITGADGAVSPGHTLLAWGGDALSAGTLRLFKDDGGKIKQAVIGTFSGHFRAGADTLTHMARHLVAAGVPPEAIVLQGGEAGSARALEVLHRALGTDGAVYQREQSDLDAEGQRFNPYVSSNALPSAKNTDAQKTLYDALFKLRLEFDSAFDDGVIHDQGNGTVNHGERLAAALTHAFTSAEIADSPVAFKQVSSILADVLDLDDAQLGKSSRRKLNSVKSTWVDHQLGAGATHAADLLSVPPTADRTTRIVAEVAPTTSIEQIRDMLRAGTDIAHVDANAPNAAALIKTLRKEAHKLGCPLSIQVDIGDAQNPKTKKLGIELGDQVVVELDEAISLADLEVAIAVAGKSTGIIVRFATRKAFVRRQALALFSNGILIDRKALAKEMGPENVPVAERHLHELGNRMGKPSIVASEVFSSMAKSSRPTRAEVEGSYRAIADLSADALMLDAGTLAGDTPGEAIRFAGRLAERAELDRSERPYLELKKRGIGPTEGTGIDAPTGGQGTPTTTVEPEAISENAGEAISENAAKLNADGERIGRRTPARLKAFAALEGPLLDDLDEAGELTRMVGVVEKAISTASKRGMGRMDGNQLAGWVAELHVLQHRVIGLTNRLSLSSEPDASMKALALLQPIANLQTTAFNRSVAIDKKRNPSEAVAWIAHVDTMKKPGTSSPLSRLDYFAAKADKFIQKGGNLDDIKSVDTSNLGDVKSGVLQEFVVDAFDNARFYDATKDVTPGHTLAAFGEDALSAGTLRLYKDENGDVAQAVIGTFSGHYRAGQESLHHMARHLIAAGIPADRIVLQGGEAGGVRALEVLHMATGADGAEAQRELDEANASAASYNPFAVTTAAEEPSGTEIEAPQVTTIGVMKKGDALGLVEATASMNEESGKLLGGPRPLKNFGPLLACIQTVLDKSEELGNPIAFSNALGMLRHFGKLDHKSGLIAPAASNLVNTARDLAEARVFGTGAPDPADMIGPRPVADRRARIVATVNPKGTQASYEKMLAAGMNVARYNPAHATPEELRSSMGAIRRAAAKLGKEVAIQIDLTGPKIRLGKFANPDNKEFNDIYLTAGETVSLTSGDVSGDDKTFPIDIDDVTDIRPGHRVFMNDGTVELMVKDVAPGPDGKPRLSAEVIKGGKVWDRKGVNLPDTALTEPTITDDDKATLDAVLDLVDVVAVSFVRHPEDILRARAEMRNRGKIVPIIAKIERPEAMEHLDKIAAVSDAMMVARGDLGVEIGPENVPAAERRIAEIGNSLGRPVMVATEVFASMAKDTEQSKAETEGLFSAVAALGVDAVMLGKETSFPDHPELTIRAASQVIEAAEAQLLDANSEAAKADAPVKMSWMDVRLGF